MISNAVEEAQARIATSPLSSGAETRPIFVTDGGWRWAWLSIGSGRAFAVTRPWTQAVVVNATDGADGTVRNGRAVSGTRALGPVLAHEFTHGLIRRRYGLLRSARFPTWKVEGYCDHVAGESSLSASDAAELRARGERPAALAYYDARRRVAGVLARHGGSPDALFKPSAN